MTNPHNAARAAGMTPTEEDACRERSAAADVETLRACYGALRLIQGAQS